MWTWTDKPSKIAVWNKRGTELDKIKAAANWNGTSANKTAKEKLEFAKLQISRELELSKDNEKKLEKKVGRHFSRERFKHSDDDMCFYTGLPRALCFRVFWKSFSHLIKFVQAFT